MGWNPVKPPEGGLQQLIDELKRLHQELGEHEHATDSAGERE
jgi:hypothetical protein